MREKSYSSGDDKADSRGREKSPTVQEMIRLTQEEQRTVLQDTEDRTDLGRENCPTGHGNDRADLRERENSPRGHGDDRADLRGTEKSPRGHGEDRTDLGERTVLQDTGRIGHT